MRSSYFGLLAGLGFAVVLVYLLIVVNFQSWLDPFIIITALPAALAGIVLFLFATHTTLSVPALMGSIMCMGVATATYPYYRFPGVAAQISLNANGHATVTTAGHEMGMGTATVQAQHAADRLGLPLEQVTFEYGDSSFPAGAMAGGSSQTAGTLAAVAAAAEALLEALLKLAGTL